MSAKLEPIYLCHKCGGKLVVGDARLYGCGCISGYVRDGQRENEDPVAYQIAHTKMTLDTYIRQGRDESYLAPERDRLAGLEAI